MMIQDSFMSDSLLWYIKHDMMNVGRPIIPFMKQLDEDSSLLYDERLSSHHVTLSPARLECALTCDSTRH